MDTIERALFAAWERVRPWLQSDPGELRRRVGRLKRGFGRPLRVWCLVVRANDTRIHEGLTAITPEKALYPRFNLGAYQRHEVTLDAEVIRTLCQPVKIDPPGQTLEEVAAKLGVTPMGLKDSRLAGVFRTHYVEGLGGKYRGRPRPVLYTEKPLDPQARHFAEADEVWGWTVRYRTACIPQALEQRVARLPCYWGRNPEAYAHAMDYLPNDTMPPVKRSPRKPRRFPPPPPDYVWYKWKGDQYIGYDWRNPAAKEGFERRERKKAQAKARYQAGRVKRPPSKSSGSLEFRGWRWICPVCDAAVRNLYYPLPPINILLRSRPRVPVIADAVESVRPPHAPPFPQGPSGFACRECHRVRRVSPAAKNFWNELVSYLSGGLLYGKEVDRPADVKPRRKLAYVKRARRLSQQSLRERAAVLEGLAAGRSYGQIASTTGLSWNQVRHHTRSLLREHGCRTRRALAREKGWTVPRPGRLPTKCDEVCRRLAAGESAREIAQAMRITLHAVHGHASRLRRERGVAATTLAAPAPVVAARAEAVA